VLGSCGVIIGGTDDRDTTTTSTLPATQETSDAPEPAPEPEPEPIQETVKLGEKVRDNYQFTVTKVTCGVKRVGDSYLGEKAQGQFCLVKMRVKAATTS
jgi:hypothetical protein